MSAMSEAVAKVTHQEREVVDWTMLRTGRWPIRLEEHKVYLTAERACWDECCGRQLIDASLAPWPETSLVGPYLHAITRHVEPRPVLQHHTLLDRRPPLYFDAPTEGPDLCYVDIDRAYWAIYSRSTLDVDYDGISAPVPGVVRFLDAAAFGEHRLARNALVGMQRRQWRRGIDHGEAFREVVPPHRRRPNLWGLVMDCLELVMWTARDAGAVYVHTDGAIFPHHDGAEDWIDLLARRFGLTASIRARGPGIVTGLGRFRIGDHVAGPATTGHRVDSMLQAPWALSRSLEEWLQASADVLAS